MSLLGTLLQFGLPAAAGIASGNGFEIGAGGYGPPYGMGAMPGAPGMPAGPLGGQTNQSAPNIAVPDVKTSPVSGTSPQDAAHGGQSFLQKLMDPQTLAMLAMAGGTLYSDIAQGKNRERAFQRQKALSDALAPYLAHALQPNPPGPLG